jgi:hypothetical protein
VRYLVRLRLIEFQDWHTPPPSSDEDYGGRSDDDNDSGDNITMVIGLASPTPAAAGAGQGRRGSGPPTIRGWDRGPAPHVSNDNGRLPSAWASSPALSCPVAPYPAPWTAAGFPRRVHYVSSRSWTGKLTPSPLIIAHSLLLCSWTQTPCAPRPASVPHRKQLTRRRVHRSSPSTMTPDGHLLLGAHAVAGCVC